jgi:hypothetical protein
MLSIHTSIEEDHVISEFLSSSLLDLWDWMRSCAGARRRYPNQPGPRFKKSIDPDGGELDYDERTLLRINNKIATVGCAAMPVVAIVALYFIKTEGGRLGVMTVFTILFAFVLARCTIARRLEIIASIAA